VEGQIYAPETRRGLVCCVLYRVPHTTCIELEWSSGLYQLDKLYCIHPNLVANAVGFFLYLDDGSGAWYPNAKDRV